MDKPPKHGIREIFGPGWPPAELKPHEKNLPAVFRKPAPVDSRFDDPEFPEQTLKPWPLCFTIFGLGTIAAIIYVLFCAAGCSATSLSSKDFTMRTQGDVKGLVVSKDGFSIQEIDHSSPTLAGGKAISSGATAFGSAATGLAAGLFTHGLK